MPNWPPAQGRRAVTFELQAEHVAHFDRQASYLGCSRAAYIRQLARRDMELHGQSAAPSILLELTPEALSHIQAQAASADCLSTEYVAQLIASDIARLQAA